jgi:hypothetical protein
MMMLKSARAGVSRLKRLWLDAGYGGKGKKWAEDGPLGLAWRPPCASLPSPYVGEGGEGVGRGAGQVRRGGGLAKAHAPAKLQSVTPQKGGGAYLLAVEPIPAHEQKDHERLCATGDTLIHVVAMTRLMVRRRALACIFQTASLGRSVHRATRRLATPLLSGLRKSGWAGGQCPPRGR